MPTSTWTSAVPDGWDAVATPWDAIPIAGNDVSFDAADGDCLVGLATPALLSLTIAAGYTGVFDAATFDVTTTGDCTLAGADVDCGSGTWTIGGNFSYVDATAFDGTTAAFVFTGTVGTETIIGKSAETLLSVEVTAGAYIMQSTASTQQIPVSASVAISGTYDTDALRRLVCGTACAFELNTGGTFTGNGGLEFTFADSGKGFTVFDGTLDCATLLIDEPLAGSVWATGVYDVGVVTFRARNGTRPLTFQAGDYTFTGDVIFESITTATALAVDNSTNDPSITFGGDLTFIETSGAVNYTRGTSVITFDGTGTHTITTAGKTLEAMVFSGTGSWTLGDAIANTAGVTVESGTLDLNGNNITVDSVGGFSARAGSAVSGVEGATITTGGGFEIIGTEDSLIDFSSPTGVCDVVATGSCTAVHAVLENCHSDLGTNGTAYASTDAGGNDGWTFIEGEPPVATDDFAEYTVGKGDPAENIIEVTPDDDNDLANMSRFVTATAGNIVGVTEGGDTVTIAIGTGVVYPIRLTRIKSTSTTATNIRVWY